MIRRHLLQSQKPGSGFLQLLAWSKTWKIQEKCKKNVFLIFRKISCLCALNTQVVRTMIKAPGVQARVLDYVLNIIQKQLLTLHNPYIEAKIGDTPEGLKYYKINKKDLNIKKTFKNCYGSKYMPSKANIKTEGERIEEFKKKFKMGEKAKMDIKPNKKMDVKLSPTDIFNAQSEDPEIEKTENKRIQKKQEKKIEEKPIFEVIEEAKNYNEMIKEQEETPEVLKLGIFLEDIDSVTKINVDISESKILLTSISG